MSCRVVEFTDRVGKWLAEVGEGNEVLSLNGFRVSVVQHGKVLEMHNDLNVPWRTELRGARLEVLRHMAGEAGSSL